VADDLVHAGADALRVAVVVQRAGVSAHLDGEVVHENVNLVCRHARLHDLAGTAQDLRCLLTRDAHALDDLG